MNDPYEVLGVQHTDDEAAVRARYLELVREFPPERAPNRFAEIREAYERLRDPVVNLESRLFDMSTPFTFESIAADAQPNARETSVDYAAVILGEIMTRTWWENEDILQQFRDWLSRAGDQIAALNDRDSQPHFDAEECFDEPDWVDDREEFETRDGYYAEAESTLNKDDRADEPAPDLPAVGLIELIAAFTALRHETKLQTKSSRGLEDSVQSALHGLEAAIRQFQTVESREEEAAVRAAKPFAEALAGLDEALTRGAEAVAASHRLATQAVPAQLRSSLDTRFEQLSRWQKWCARGWHQHVQNACQEEISTAIDAALRRVMQGYGLIQARLTQVMREQGVARIECLGQPVDPTQMTVVELVDDASAEPEAVLEEVRPGYTYRGKVIRFAEVRTARRLDTP